MGKLFRIVVFASCWIGTFATAHAASDATDWTTTPQTQVRLVAGESGTGTDGSVRLGLHFKLKDGWKIYWRRPGDAGFPPRLSWIDSENFADADFGWPAPTRFQVLGFQTMGYAKEVVFPITVRLDDPSRPLKVRARLDYLTCDDICIPYSADLSLDIPARPGIQTSHAALIEDFQARIPRGESENGLKIEKVETAGPFKAIDESARAGAIRIQATSPIRFAAPDVFIEGPDLAFFGAPDVRYADGGRRAVLTVPVTLEDRARILGANLRLTLTDSGRAIETERVVDEGSAQTAPASSTPLMLILIFAFIGGFILNLMPCVLPVLSLKILSFAQLGGQSRGRISASFLATATGIVASFLLIAAALAALKSAGAEIGWGIQFQNPWFVGALAVVTALFAANLFGMFSIPLPAWLGTAAATTGAGRGPNLVGDFATGAFATLLATPCSAPFLGTAIGFALAGAPSDIFPAFAAMGLGMALPYLAVAALPQIARALPKPGRWMIRLRQILGLGLAATAIWLVSIVGAQITTEPALPSAGRSVAQGSAVAWQSFDQRAISDLIAQGKTVFVDITADWCITCKVNKIAVLDRSPVRELLDDPNVVAMQGDWTRPDPEIATYLQSFGRYALPFNAVYGPALPGGQALSELLTTNEVTAALDRASGGTLAKGE